MTPPTGRVMPYALTARYCPSMTFLMPFVLVGRWTDSS